MKWFRFYTEVLDDPKVQLLPDRLFRLWVNLLCLANETTPRGTLPDLPAIAFRLRISEQDAQEALDEFGRRGLIDIDDAGTSSPHNWDSRQRRSDSSAERVTAYRERQRATGNSTKTNEPVTSNDTSDSMNHDGNATRNAPVTLQVTPPDIETDTEPDPEEKTGAARPVPAEDTPFSLFEALMDLVGAPGRKPPSPAWRDKQLGIAKRLLEQGHGTAQVRKCIAFMQSQSWRGSPIDLGQVERVIDAWEVSGEPERDTSRGRSTRQPDAEDGVKRRGYSYDAVTRAASGY